MKKTIILIMIALSINSFSAQVLNNKIASFLTNKEIKNLVFGQYNLDTEIAAVSKIKGTGADSIEKADKDAKAGVQTGAKDYAYEILNGYLNSSLVSGPGFNSSKMREFANEIAKEAGISIGTLYSYFSNKEEILSLILKDYNESFIVIFNQLNTSENLELFSSDYKGWIGKLIDNLISLEDKEFHAQIEMLSYSIPEVKEIQDQHNDKMKELTYQCLKHYVGNKEITNLKSISNILFNFITSIVDEILYSSHSDEEITVLRKTSLDCIALILENLLYS